MQIYLLSRLTHDAEEINILLLLKEKGTLKLIFLKKTGFYIPILKQFLYNREMHWLVYYLMRTYFPSSKTRDAETIK